MGLIMASTALALLLPATMAICAAAFLVISRFKVPYFAGMLIILGSLLMEHWLARRRTLNWINMAFFRLNALVSIVFFAAVAAEVLFPAFRFRR